MVGWCCCCCYCRLLDEVNLAMDDLSSVLYLSVFFSVNPKRILDLKTDFAFLFGKSRSGCLILWILFEKEFFGFEIGRVQIQLNGLVINAVPFTVNPKLVRWSTSISSWSIEKFTLIVLPWVIRAKWREIRRFVFVYVWCFLFKKSNLRVQRNSILNLECKQVPDQFLENLDFPIHFL